jgi:hypothetical protein
LIFNSVLLGEAQPDPIINSCQRKDRLFRESLLYFQ